MFYTLLRNGKADTPKTRLFTLADAGEHEEPQYASVIVVASAIKVAELTARALSGAQSYSYANLTRIPLTMIV